MRCEDFREIADSFLCDELLVETNHEAIRHLENCESCRGELASHKTFREKLRDAVVNAPDAQINPVFAARLRSELKRDFVKEERQSVFRQSLFSAKFLTASLAFLILMLLIPAFIFLPNRGKEEPVANSKTSRTNIEPTENLNAMWQKIADQAIGDHRHCGLEKIDFWQKNADRETPEKIRFREHFLQKTTFKPTEPMKLLHVHDCIFDGRTFTHAVIRIGNRTVSVLLTETELTSRLNKNSSPNSTINCQKQTGFQIASFVGLNKAVFVISDLPEAKNLDFARSLSNAMQS